ALRYQLACAYYQSGEYDHACECAAQLIEVERNEGGEISDYRIFDLLGNAHFALGRYEEARIAYSQALKLTSPHSKENASIRRYHDFAQSRIAG
ncbi:MAG: tetratricopeptide repeat protein, partial [Anaerolineaceae bacterium]|nr:tetratricopeptide repeat protein [Anaerolineaceae bacterium]